MRKLMRASLSVLLALLTLFTAACGAAEEPAPAETPQEPAPTEAPPTPAHEWKNGVCTRCGALCEHSWEDGVCAVCGTVCRHRLEDGVCAICGFGCTHAAHDPDTGICLRCGRKAEHSFINGVCARCGEKPRFIEELKGVPAALAAPAYAHGRTETFHYPLNEGEIVPGPHGIIFKEDLRMRDMVVYLPAGYDPGKQYDVLILVPGAGHNVHYWMERIHRLNSTVGRLSGAELLDRMIETGQIPPTIVAAVEYYLSGTPEEIAIPFERDLRERVLPFLAARYSTYASVDENGAFIPAPEHFGYIAASFGAMIGWQMIPTATDLFAYWSLLSGAFQNDEELTERINRGVRADRPIHWLYAGDGRLAQGWGSYAHRIEALSVNCDRLDLGSNLSFLAADKTSHNLPAWDVGLINSLKVFFRSRFDPSLLETEEQSE